MVKGLNLEFALQQAQMMHFEDESTDDQSEDVENESLSVSQNRPPSKTAKHSSSSEQKGGKQTKTAKHSSSSEQKGGKQTTQQVAREAQQKQKVEAVSTKPAVVKPKEPKIKKPVPTSPLELMKHAADSGDSIAQTLLAESYEKGIDVEKDEQKAFELVKQAALKGTYIPAQTQLARYYRLGIGTTVDFAKAFLWNSRAARKGDATAKALQDEYESLTGNGVDG